jgi:acetyl-CoA carboxylase biotin carboxyl carrier protein
MKKKKEAAGQEPDDERLSMNLQELKELIELVSEKGFAEFEVERKGFRLRMSRFKEPTAPSSQTAAQPAPSAPQSVQGEASSPSASDPAQAAQPAESEAATSEPQLFVLSSPIVGTFYRSPSPDAPPFVEVGSSVKKGQVLCIIEAMKLMNEIESDVDGVVMQIYPQNSQAVEYGEPLFGIKT